MQMESQITPTIWFPTLCHITPNTLHLDEIAKHRQFLQPYIPAPAQPYLLPAHSTSHIVLQQIVHPYLPATQSADSTAALTQQQATNGLSTTTVASNPGTEHLYGPGDRNLMFGPTFQAAGPLLIPHHSFNAKLSQQQTLEINLNEILTHKTIASKTQRKKKVSPSAKRRSRKRLMAFLEAKRKKDSTTITEGNDTVEAKQAVILSEQNGDEKESVDLSQKSSSSPSTINISETIEPIDLKLEPATSLPTDSESI